MVLCKRFLLFLSFFTFLLSGALFAILIPVTFSPVGETATQNGKVLFEWQSLPNTDHYELTAYQSDAQGNIDWNNSILDLAITPEEAECNTSGRCQTLQTVGVSAAKWKIRAVSPQGEKSDYTDYIFFNINGSTSFSVNDDEASVTQGQQVTIDVLANDSGSGLSIEAIDDVWTGSISIVNDTIEYVADNNFTGELEVWYGARDNNGDSDWAQITITINPQSGLDAKNDVATVTKGQQVTIDVLTNDSGSGLTLAEVDEVWTGSIQIDNNKLIYNASGSYTGNIEVWYGAEDLNGDTDWAKITITINSPNTNTYPSYFPSEVPYENWSTRPHPTDDQIEQPEKNAIIAPSFQGAIVDIKTGKKVWRLGGSPSEMNGSKLHPNNDISIYNAQHFYSRTTPTNKDESYAISASDKGYAALWKLSSKQLVAWIPTGTVTDGQQRQILWDKNDNNVFWYTSGNKLYRAEIDLTTYTVTPEKYDTFNDFEYVAFGPGEGEFSDDGEKIVIAGKHKSSNDFTIISYLVNTKERKASLTIEGEYYANTNETVTLDWAGVDPTGQYVVYNRPSEGESMWVLPFDDLSGEPRLLYKHMKHSDFVVDENSVAWLVFGHWQGLFATKLEGPVLKRIWPTRINAGDPEQYPKAEIDVPNKETASGHVSRVSGLPGVVLMARNKDGGLYYVNINRPEKTIYVGNTWQGRLPSSSHVTPKAWGVDKEGEVTEYKREPRASASQSGKYIFFVSDYHVHGANYPNSDIAYLNVIDLKAP